MSIVATDRCESLSRYGSASRTSTSTQSHKTLTIRTVRQLRVPGTSRSLRQSHRDPGERRISRLVQSHFPLLALESTAAAAIGSVQRYAEFAEAVSRSTTQ